MVISDHVRDPSDSMFVPLGTSNESYITHLVHQAAQHGYR